MKSKEIPCQTLMRESAHCSATVATQKRAIGKRSETAVARVFEWILSK